MYSVFTCKNRLRYTRARASQSFGMILFINSFASLLLTEPGGTQENRGEAANAARSVRPLHVGPELGAGRFRQELQASTSIYLQNRRRYSRDQVTRRSKSCTRITRNVKRNYALKSLWHCVIRPKVLGRALRDEHTLKG